MSKRVYGVWLKWNETTWPAGDGWADNRDGVPCSFSDYAAAKQMADDNMKKPAMVAATVMVMAVEAEPPEPEETST
jgi:hypothetical protein